MPSRSEAEDHLRAIRSLMEKATIYRAVSAPSALIGGLLSVVTALVLFRTIPPHELQTGEMDLRVWMVAPWLGVLLVTAVANLWFLHREARSRGDRFVSPGMRTALFALSPALSVGGFFTVSVLIHGKEFFAYLLPAAWMLFYGLALLSTALFAPRSIAWLGWTFLVSGLASLHLITAILGNSPNGAQWTNGLMALTFGLFHLIYAACTWPRKRAQADSGAMP